MSYLLESNTKYINEDIIKRKEFARFKINDDSDKHDHIEKNIVPRFVLDKMIRDGNYLRFSSYQLFVNNYINPNTPYTRLLLKWETGTGKTIGSISIAMKFIQYYQRESINSSINIGSIFIIGFTSQQFKTELLRYPEFGFISRSELRKLKLLKKAAYDGNIHDLEILHEFLIRIKKRFNNREGNGFFQFKGYKKLVNDIFIINDEHISLTNLDEEGIFNAIKTGKIKLNKDLLEQFKNSLIICDEIHNTYNSVEKNNWGIAIQYILNHHPSIRAVYLSATPINNNPTEIIDLLNLLLPITIYPKKLHKEDFFDNKNQLKRGALDKIAELCKGKISYLRDVNPLFFPTKKFIGESIPGAPYLKFIRCPMSKFHYDTYKQIYTGTLSLESQYLVDFALPNPSGGKIGIYKTGQVKKELQYASQSWKDKNKINYKKDRIVGDILRMHNLHKISNKFYIMLKNIMNMIHQQCGKIFIYHNIIHMSGVLFIQDILFQNNIIGEYDNSTENTLCSVCGQPRKNHTVKQLGGGESKDNGKTNYNTTTNTYEIFLPNSDKYKLPILEYKLCCNIIFIPSILIDFANNNVNIIAETIKKSCELKRIVIESKKLSVKLQSLLKLLNFSKMNINDNVSNYYSSSSLNKLTHSEKFNLIKKFKKIKSYKFNTGKDGGSKRNKSPLVNSIDKNHTYMPVRCIVAHSMLDRSKMMASIEKYNSPDNADGTRIMILIGGKIVKEAFDIKAVREVIIMGRPANIPTLIQILGRAVRKGSHKDVLSSKRNVNIRIFTSCLPIKSKIGGKLKYKLSYEEEKYIEKLNYYQTIQTIEKTLHENAIDSVINKDIIWPKHEQNNKKSKELGPLYFEPNLPKKIINKQFRLNELNLETFNAFHSSDEINDIIIIIKRLFIEKSTVWVYKDLFTGVKNAYKYRSYAEFNTELISEHLFIVALSRLLWTNDLKYKEPLITHANKQTGSIIDLMFDYDNKIIILPGGQKSIINQVGKYYMLFPIDENINKPIKVAEFPYRINTKKEKSIIDIKWALESGNTLEKYTYKKNKFYTKWNNISIDNLELSICEFGTDFHISFLEECIEYVFNVWTSNKIKKSEYHNFYFKMLYYYDLHKLVIWGNTAKSLVFKKYKHILNNINTSIQKTNKYKLKDIKSTQIESSGLINMLKSSINKSDVTWLSSGLKKYFETNLNKSLTLFDGLYKKKTNTSHKINADIVPVGHVLNYIPRFYHPLDGWFESPEYLNCEINYVENNIIIGYDERSKTGIHIRFKIRSPIQNIKQYKDTRMIEKGSMCVTKNKIYLKEIAKKIGIELKGKINVISLCGDIRTKLIYLELKERMANTKKKWFYFIYERRPETNLDEL